MIKHGWLVWALLASTIARADELPTSPVQQFLQSGQFAQGEVSLTLHLDEHPKDDEARFGLGVLQFMRALEKVGQSLYEYGGDSTGLGMSLPALPIPHNDQPATISFPEFQRIMRVFVADLKTADETLAQIVDPDVKLKLRLAQINFDFTKSGRRRVTLADILKQLNNSSPLFPADNPDIRIHFDRGDVAWLRAYGHLLASLAEVTLAFDVGTGAHRWLSRVFPKCEPAPKEGANVEPSDRVVVVDAICLRRFRLHLLSVCELNRETWSHIRQERDDDYEWLSNTRQKDQLGLPISDQQIDAWLSALADFEGLLKGESLLPGELFSGITEDFPADQGLNLRKLMDDPPSDFLNWQRLQRDGIHKKYLEAIAGKKEFNTASILRLVSLFGGPFGFARAARLN